ncbi:MAG: hypothetical protein HXS48_25990 [Theionarchaea archaeon]|nr:MAG: hypothetical protein AYK19_13225 [Theionarchaea archaeon DG-70-1]MBU7030410.1 hypothetical protein [Theionarchaea archaeon]
MLVIRLKQREEFQKLCQGKAVFFSVNDGYIHYFTPAKVNEVEAIYTFYSKTPMPFREHYDLNDTEGVRVKQLTEVGGVSCFDMPRGLAHSEIRSVEVEEALV